MCIAPDGKSSSTLATSSSSHPRSSTPPGHRGATHLAAELSLEEHLKRTTQSNCVASRMRSARTAVGAIRRALYSMARRNSGTYIMPASGAAQPAQQRDVAGRVERVRSALAFSATQSPQLRLSQVIPVHPHQHGCAVQRVDQSPGHRGLARSQRTGDAEDPPTAAVGERLGTGEQIRPPHRLRSVNARWSRSALWLPGAGGRRRRSNPGPRDHRLHPSGANRATGCRRG